MYSTYRVFEIKYHKNHFFIFSFFESYTIHYTRTSENIKITKFWADQRTHYAHLLTINFT